MWTIAYLPARLHVTCKAVCKPYSATVSMLAFQFIAAVVWHDKARSDLAPDANALHKNIRSTVRERYQ